MSLKISDKVTLLIDIDTNLKAGIEGVVEQILVMSDKKTLYMVKFSPEYSVILLPGETRKEAKERSN